MQRSDFTYQLPEELIAKFPPEQRGNSRLLVLSGNESKNRLDDRVFSELIDYLDAGDVLVFNNTRVIPARVYGQKASGGKLEILVERILDHQHALVHMRSSRSPKAGQQIYLEGGQGQRYEVDVVGRSGALFQLALKHDNWMDVLAQIGHMPLPPYIQRADEKLDQERYQTVYATESGAVAAPTAGLHFSPDFMQCLQDKGVEFAYVTLHVGAGTFQPVKVDNILEHVMHSELIHVDHAVCEQVKQAKVRGNKVVAVGTTSVRSLESAARSGELLPFAAESDIFIYPGYQFKVVDALLTNFHLPESTLLMLVSALAGIEPIRKAYQHAIEQKYRFFSYGDAMLIHPQAAFDQ